MVEVFYDVIYKLVIFVLIEEDIIGMVGMIIDIVGVCMIGI